MENPDIDGCFPSYVVRVYESWGDIDKQEWLAEYDTNTINLRAAVEYLGMVTRKHKIDPEAFRFRDDCKNIEKMWWHYAELR
jgi:hypothetical protein